MKDRNLDKMNNLSFSKFRSLFFQIKRSDVQFDFNPKFLECRKKEEMEKWLVTKTFSQIQ